MEEDINPSGSSQPLQTTTNTTTAASVATALMSGYQYRANENILPKLFHTLLSVDDKTKQCCAIRKHLTEENAQTLTSVNSKYEYHEICMFYTNLQRRVKYCATCNPEYYQIRKDEHFRKLAKLQHSSQDNDQSRFPFRMHYRTFRGKVASAHFHNKTCATFMPFDEHYETVCYRVWIKTNPLVARMRCHPLTLADNSFKIFM